MHLLQTIYNILRPALFKLDAEKAHYLSLNALNALHYSGLLSKRKLHLENQTYNSACTYFGLNFKNRIGLAAGLDKNACYIDALAKLGFGFIEVGTVTPEPQSGNAMPRLWRVSEQLSIINRMGFNNNGVDALVRNVQKSKWVKNGGILGINIGKNAVTPLNLACNDYLICLNKVYNYASYITVNISSPNTVGLRDLQTGDSFIDLVKNIKLRQLELADKYQKYVPVLIKIAPDLNIESIHAIADNLTYHKIDGVIATNTTINQSALSENRRQEGGLSGLLLQSQANWVLRTLAMHIQDKIPIIGVGGIITSNDVHEKIRLGASLVQLYTGFIYNGPKLITASK
jgi:dihydroorotate dehydrogenase